jgi:hypothetical protein
LFAAHSGISFRLINTLLGTITLAAGDSFNFPFGHQIGQSDITQKAMNLNTQIFP